MMVASGETTLDATVEAVLAQLDAALDAAAELDARNLPVDDVGAYAVAMQQRLARLDAVAAHAAGAFDVNGDPQGARSAAAWLSYCARLPKWQAKHTIAASRALRRMPTVDAAFSAGEVNREHVRVLAAAQSLNPKMFAKAEHELLHDARTCRFDVFRRKVEYWRQVAEPEIVEDEAESLYDGRHAHASKTFGCTVVIDASLDPIAGDIWLTELRRLEKQLFERDWADARDALGRDPLIGDLGRTPAQRRADAMLVMAHRSAALAPGSTFARPLVNVLVGYETFAGRMCELADGTVITPGQVVSLLDDADIRRVVFDGPSRVIDVGVRQRFFTGADRVAVQLRDLECQGDVSCDVRFPDCEIDHIEPASSDGPTVQSNGRCLCRWHHRRRRPRAP